MKLENKNKKRGKIVLPALGERIDAKRTEENAKNSKDWLDRLVRDKKVFEKFLKSEEITWKTPF